MLVQHSWHLQYISHKLVMRVAINLRC